MTGSIRVAVVDDSPFICRLLADRIAAEPDLECVGAAHNGRDALALIPRLRPDVVTLDYQMPGDDGLVTLDRILRHCPTPVILLTGTTRSAADVTLRAMRLGAVDFVLKYDRSEPADAETVMRDLMSKIRAAATAGTAGLRPRRTAQASGGGAHAPARQEIKPPNDAASSSRGASGRSDRLDRRANSKIGDTSTSRTTSPSVAAPAALGARRFPTRVVVVGGSTGGALALRRLLEEIPATTTDAFVVVQHMPPEFTSALSVQLDRQCPLEVKEATEGEPLRPGDVRVAPGDRHLRLSDDFRIRLDDDPAVNGYRPSIDVTMRSVAALWGRASVGVLLSGMGRDGVEGMRAILDAGGETFAQDAATCVVNGMPQRAIDRGAVQTVATPESIGQQLRRS